MKTSISLLLWTPFVEERHLPILAELKAMGYDGVEVPVAAGDDDAHYEWLGGELRGLGLETTAVGFLTAEEDPSGEDPVGRARAVERIEQLARRARMIDAGLIAGPVHEAYAHFPGPITEDELALATDTLARGAERAAREDVALMIEPLNRFESRLANTLEQAAALVRAAAQPNLGVTFDTHHAHLEADDLLKSVAEAGPWIRHVQFSENHRGVPGTGQIDFQEVARALKAQNYEGWLVVEAFSRFDPALGDMLRIWRDLAADWQVVAQKGLRVIQEAWGPA